MKVSDFKKDLEILEIGLDENGLPVPDQTNKESIKYKMYLLNHKPLNLQMILPNITIKTVKKAISVLYSRSFRLNKPMVTSTNS